MKSFWQNLSDRDKLALGIGGGVVLLYLIYLLIVAPLIHVLDEKHQHHQDKKKDLAWLHSVRSLSQTKQSRTLASNSELLSLLARQLKSNNLKAYPHQLQQLGNGNIQLSFESVPFMLFMDWLKQLNTTIQFTIQNLTIDRLDTPGLAQVALTLSAS